MTKVHESRWYITGLTVVRLSFLMSTPVYAGLFARIALLCGVLDLQARCFVCYNGVICAVCMHSGL